MTALVTLILPMAASSANLPKTAEASEQSPSGKVVETMNSGGYTYAKLGKNGKTTWVAFETKQVRVGDALSFENCSAMKDSQSKSLNRKFDLIYFCQQSSTGAAAAKPAMMAAKKSSGSDGAAAAPQPKIKVDKATGPNAYTIEQLFAKSAALNGKQVVVKGQVVKVSPRIMSRNWIHLQDGSGNAKKKNDLVVTSTELPRVGEVVTASGILAKDKDFGGGYKYSVIIEKGGFKK